MALMTPPLAFSLLCDKNRLFGAKRNAGMRCFHKQTGRKKERKKDIYIYLYHGLLILLKYYAADAANNVKMNGHQG